MKRDTGNRFRRPSSRRKRLHPEKPSPWEEAANRILAGKEHGFTLRRKPRSTGGRVGGAAQVPRMVEDETSKMSGPRIYRLSVDGACSGNPGPGGWAVHLLRPDGTEELFSGSAQRTTNNQMEVIAVVQGLRRVPIHAEVEVQTDSALVIGWLAEGWRRNKVALRPILDDADALIAARHVRFVKVRGHTGDPRNELVNERAEGEAADAAAHVRGKPP